MTGTSITPVREAFKLLEAEGVILGCAHRGAVVAHFDLLGAEELVDLRVMLECRLALRTISRLGADSIDRLRAVQTALEVAAEVGDRSAVRQFNHRFHDLIYLAADAPQTLRFVRALWARYPFDLISALDDRSEQTSAEHREMLGAILARDEPALLAALRTHIRSGWDALRLSAAA